MKPNLSPYAAALLALSACRDLDLPRASADGEAPNAGPSIRFVTPEPGAPVALDVAVKLEASDVDGLREVTLSCGDGILLRRWLTGPYEAQVNLSACGAGAEGPVALHADAVDRRGAASETPASTTVALDARIAGLAVQVPPRVAPGGTLTAQIDSDVALQGLPVVRVEGATAQVVDRGPASEPLRHFTATLSPLPGLGTDLPGGGTIANPTLEQLEQVSRSLVVEVEGRAGNGNLTRVTVPTELSRVLWERALPATTFAVSGHGDPKAPVATARGLVVATGTTSSWLPLYLDAQSARVTTLGPAQLDAAEYAVGLLPDGTTVFVNPNLQTVRFLPEAATGAGLSVNGKIDFKLSPLWRLGPNLCEYASTFADGTCGSLRYSCLGPDGVRVEQPLPNPANAQGLFGANPAITFDRALEPQNDCCGYGETFQAGPGIARCVKLGNANPMQPLLAAGAGVAIGTEPDVATWKLNPDGTGVKFAATTLALAPEFAWTDTVAVVSAGIQSSTLELYDLAGTTPFATTQLPGDVKAFDRAVAWSGGLALPLELGATGSASSGGAGKFVAALTPQIAPRWIYRYPYATNNLLLVADDAGTSPLYLVDLDNHRVVALQR